MNVWPSKIGFNLLRNDLAPCGVLLSLKNGENTQLVAIFQIAKMNLLPSDSASVEALSSNGKWFFFRPLEVASKHSKASWPVSKWTIYLRIPRDFVDRVWFVEVLWKALLNFLKFQLRSEHSPRPSSGDMALMTIQLCVVFVNVHFDDKSSFCSSSYLKTEFSILKKMTLVAILFAISTFFQKKFLRQILKNFLYQ